MIRTIGWLIWLFGYLISRLPAYWKAKRLEKKGDMAAVDAIVAQQVDRWTGRLLHHIKMHMDIEGLENLPAPSEPVVFAANHQSYLDIPVLLNIIKPPRPLLARRSLGQIPMLAGWMRLIGCVFVQRDDVRASVAALRECEQLLEKGKSVIIFPEGTRSRGPQLGNFQAGAVRMALKTGVRIVPVAIEGTYKGLEGNRYRVQPTQVRVQFLPPLETKGLDKAGQKELPKQLEAMIQKAKDE